MLSCAHTDTTDLQAVNVVVTKASDTIEVTCDFISGSDAQGCMVVLVGQHENTTVNLTRDDECTTKPLSLTTLQNNVFGFDIEQDGSVSTLAIPGTISTRDNDDPLCLPNNTQLQINVSSTTGKFLEALDEFSPCPFMQMCHGLF